ncbi:MAG: hypothetical protein KJ077_10610 [Anaerolineae bacterium]|nr:hypothetical protein [Anaerolineae bacterium]
MGKNLLKLEYVLLDEAKDWEWLDNPKLHDTEAIITSIKRYGFADPPKFDSSLLSAAGQGAIIGGNGRTLALVAMRERGMEPPVGIALTHKGEWAIPILFGNDLPSQEAAAAFAIDHNNLTLAGGTLTGLDMARMYSVQGYNELLATLRDADTLPVSVSDKDVEELLARVVHQAPPVVVTPTDLFGEGEEVEEKTPEPTNPPTAAPAPADLVDEDDLDEQGEGEEGAGEGTDSGNETTPPPVALANTQAQIGRYNLTILRDDYLNMIEDIRQTAGFEQAKILAEIRRRLRIPEEPVQDEVA